MKTSRIFILIGACGLLFTASISFEPVVSRSGASELPVVYYDPRAGDPDEPFPGYALPFEEEVNSTPSKGRLTAQPLEYSPGSNRVFALFHRFMYSLHLVPSAWATWR